METHSTSPYYADLMRKFSALLTFTAVTFGAALAAAQSADAVVVLGSGGVERVAAFDIARQPEVRAINLGTRRVVPAEVGPVEIGDIKILRDGSYLLSDVSGRGVVVTRADGSEFTLVYDPTGQFQRVSAASVASYFSVGEPSLLLMADPSGVAIRRASTQTVSWFRPLSIASSTARVVQVIAMPDNVVAVALNWPSAGVSAVQLGSSLEVEPFAEFESAEHLESSDQAIVVPELDGLRDLQGLANGNLLVTTRYAVLELTQSGEVVGEWAAADYPAMNGELASARMLASGLVAVATFEPGEWVRPHTNHRVHWIDPADAALVATSESLLTAPTRVEGLTSTGGTGTVGFDAGLTVLEQGDPEDVELADLAVDPAAVEVGDELIVTATVRNAGAGPVALSRIVVRGSRGPCQPGDQDDYDFAVEESVALGADQSIVVQSEQVVDARFGLGTWCAYVETLDQMGVWRSVGEGLEFEVVEADDSTGSVIDVTPLPYNLGRDFGFEVDMDAGDAGRADEFVPKKGCCATSRGAPTSAILFWLVLVLMVARRPSATGRARR